MEDKVRAYITENQMIQPGDRILLGLSGGADSVCLFFLLLAFREQLGFELACVHVHHGLRGAGADEDEAFVQRLCAEHGVACRSFFYDVKREAERQGCSEEEMGRRLRYRSFERVLQEWDYNKIAVAHHMADQAETVLYHLCRGSGLTGLTGMHPVSGKRIRPLLCLQKEEILAYLTERHISWREDETNTELLYTRNRIRRLVLPCLEEHVNAASVAHIAACARALGETERYIKKQAQAAWELCAEIRKEEVCLRLERYSGLDIVIQKQLLFRALETLGGSRRDIQSVHLDMALALLSAQSGREVSLPGGVRVVREYETLCLRTGSSRTEEKGELVIRTDIAGEYELPGGSGLLRISGPVPAEEIPPKEIMKNEENVYTKWFDYDRIKDNLLLRTRREGDYLQLSGQMTKKLKAYLIDSKVPRQKRDAIWLLADGSHILWAVGYRISDGCKIRQDTGRAVRVEIKWR